MSSRNAPPQRDDTKKDCVADYPLTGRWFLELLKRYNFNRISFITNEKEENENVTQAKFKPSKCVKTETWSAVIT